MVRNINCLRISTLSAVVLVAALAGCNSPTSNPDSSPGAPITPVKSTTVAPGNNRSDNNMPGNNMPNNNGNGNNMPGNNGNGNHMPNNNGNGNSMPGNNGNGNHMHGKGMGGMGDNR